MFPSASATTDSATALASVANNSFWPASTATPTHRRRDRSDSLSLCSTRPRFPASPASGSSPTTLGGILPTAAHIDNAFIPGTGRFKADLAVADLDYNATTKDTLALKYYYQHDPTLAPYAYSSVPGFTEHLDSGAQVISINNTYLVKPNLSTTETIGFLREKNWGDNEQAFGPSTIPGGSVGTVIHQHVRLQLLSPAFPSTTCSAQLSAGRTSAPGILNIGPNAEGQASNTGVFQNRLRPRATPSGLSASTPSASAPTTPTPSSTPSTSAPAPAPSPPTTSASSLQGLVTPGQLVDRLLCHLVPAGQRQPLLPRQPARHVSAGQVPDHADPLAHRRRALRLGRRPDREIWPHLQLRSQLVYSYNAATDTITNPGFIIAGNNANGTTGVSNTTLTGRQWGIGPRLGAAWQPEMFHNKVVVRTGGGMYYDRGELFSYFSPGYAIGTVTGGPFGVNQQLPFVNASTCPTTSQSLYEYYIPTCGGNGGFGPPPDRPRRDGNLENPYGTTLQHAAPTNPKASDLSNYLPNAYSIENYGTDSDVINNGQPISLGVYDRANKLPYTYQLHARHPVAAAQRPGH